MNIVSKTLATAGFCVSAACGGSSTGPIKGVSAASYATLSEGGTEMLTTAFARLKDGEPFSVPRELPTTGTAEFRGFGAYKQGTFGDISDVSQIVRRADSVSQFNADVDFATGNVTAVSRKFYDTKTKKPIKGRIRYSGNVNRRADLTRQFTVLGEGSGNMTLRDGRNWDMVADFGGDFIGKDSRDFVGNIQGYVFTDDDVELVQGVFVAER